MNRTQCALTDAANKIKEYFLRIGLPVTLDDNSQKYSDAVKEFASEVRKTIKDTYQSFGGS